DNLAGLSINGQSVPVAPGPSASSYVFALDLPLPSLQNYPVSIRAWDHAGRSTDASYILNLSSAIQLTLLSPASGSEYVVSGTDYTLEVTARVLGAATGDELYVLWDGAGAMLMERLGDYGRAMLTVAATGGEHALRIEVRRLGVLQATTESRVTFTRDEDVPLEVVSISPENEASDVETTTPIEIRFNKPVDPARLTMSVLQTAHGKIFAAPEPGADIRNMPGLALEEVRHERSPVAGNGQNLPGNQAIAFYPSEYYAYGGTVMVELALDGVPLFHSRFGVRTLPTLLSGVLMDSDSTPLIDMEVSLFEIGRSARSDKDGNFQFGYGEDPTSMLAPGRYRALINPPGGDARFGSVERYIDVDGPGATSLGVFVVPKLNPRVPYQPIASGQGVVSLALGDLEMDLSGATLEFPDGRAEGLVHVQLLEFRELGHGVQPGASPEFAFAMQPPGIEVAGVAEVTVRLPKLQGSHNYVQQLLERVLLLGLDARSLTLVPIGVARVDKTQNTVVSEGALHLERLEYVGVAIFAARQIHQEALAAYAAGEISIDELRSQLAQ
ncbi:MAG: Ig-like domain-containing protein, partial [Myxococcales bacterium]|nr:Ig-like domain-containing protein [Myxococcales bacterium]